MNRPQRSGRPRRPLRLVATCSLGLEEFVVQELEALGVEAPQSLRGAVTFEGDWPLCWKANLWLRTANRVLVEVGSWLANDNETLYQGAYRLVERSVRSKLAGLSAAELFAPAKSFSIKASSSRSVLRDTRWIGQKTKDAIVDAQRKFLGRRASIDRRNPDRPWRVLLQRDRATLLLDTSGEPLDRRGYRLSMVDAPVREQLAAACVLASGWQGEGPVLDPMCGSGTLLAEAAHFALGWGPNRNRDDWPFADLSCFDARTFRRMRSEAGHGVRLPPMPRRVYGGDTLPEALRATESNLERGGILPLLQLHRRSVLDWQPPAEQGLVLINPPYGERLAEQPDLWPALGDWLKQRMKGWTAVLLAGELELAKRVGLRPRRRIPVMHGQLDARILVFDLY